MIGCKNCLPANPGFVQGVKGRVPCVCNPNPQVKVCDSCSLCVKRREQAAQK